MWFNWMMIWLLKSPLHGVISKGVMLVTVMGRKSGKPNSTPIIEKRRTREVRPDWIRRRGTARLCRLRTRRAKTGSGEDRSSVKIVYDDADPTHLVGQPVTLKEHRKMNR